MWDLLSPVKPAFLVKCNFHTAIKVDVLYYDRGREFKVGSINMKLC